MENSRMVKYKEYYDRMVRENKEVFDKFANLHADYGMDNDKYQEEFNEEGEKIMKLVHLWEDKLCSHSEKSGYGSYTGGLAEKFQAEVRAHLPLIDHVGIIVKPKFSIKQIKHKTIEPKKFSLKKIKLS